MQIFLETERLLLRPFQKDDLAQFTILLNNPGVSGWQKQLPHAAEFLDWYISQYRKMDIFKGVVCFGVFDKTNSQAIGAAGVGEHDDLHEPELF